MCTKHLQHYKKNKTHLRFTVVSPVSASFVTISPETVQNHINNNMGISGLVVECQTRNFLVTGSNLTAGHLQATLSKLLRSTQPPTLHGMGNE